jgi:hypothetical protein
VTVAATSALLGLRSSNDVLPIVVASIASLNTAVTAVVAATPVAPLVGVTLLTVGGVVSGVVVVNDQVKLAASALPARSFTRGSVAPPLTVAV